MVRFIKPRASTMFGNLVYFLDGPGPSIYISGPHEEYFNIAFALWKGGNIFSDECCRTIRMNEVWRDLELMHLRVEHLSILCQELALRRARVVPGKMACQP